PANSRDTYAAKVAPKCNDKVMCLACRDYIDPYCQLHFGAPRLALTPILSYEDILTRIPNFFNTVFVPLFGNYSPYAMLSQIACDYRNASDKSQCACVFVQLIFRLK